MYVYTALCSVTGRDKKTCVFHVFEKMPLNSVDDVGALGRSVWRTRPSWSSLDLLVWRHLWALGGCHLASSFPLCISETVEVPVAGVGVGVMLTLMVVFFFLSLQRHLWANYAMAVATACEDWGTLFALSARHQGW